MAEMSAEEAKQKGVTFISAEQLGKELLAGKQRAVARLNRGVQQLRSSEWEASMQHDGKSFSAKGKYIVTQMPKRTDDKKRCDAGLVIAKRMAQELRGAGFVVNPFLMSEDSFSFSAEHQAQADATPPAVVKDALDADAPPMTEKAAVDLGARRQAPGVMKDGAIKEQMAAAEAANRIAPTGRPPILLAPGETGPPAAGQEAAHLGPPALNGSDGPPAEPPKELPEAPPGEPSPTSQ